MLSQPPSLSVLAALFDHDWWELASFVVTVIGLPFAIAVFIWEQRRERQNDQEEIYQRLSDDYAEFLKLTLEHADLKLTHADVAEHEMTEEQRERKAVLFEILTALFERAYLLVYEEKMDRQSARLWASWEDYMRSWCRRKDYRSQLSQLLQGEDPDFASYLHTLGQEEGAKLVALAQHTDDD